MRALGQREAAVLAALRGAAEGEPEDGYRLVYLDNARAQCPELTGRQWAWTLGALSLSDQLYKPVDGFAWGKVKEAT